MARAPTSARAPTRVEAPLVGKQAFIRRSVLDAYVESQPITFAVDPAADEQAEAERLVASLGRRRPR